MTDDDALIRALQHPGARLYDVAAGWTLRVCPPERGRGTPRCTVVLVAQKPVAGGPAADIPPGEEDGAPGADAAPAENAPEDEGAPSTGDGPEAEDADTATEDADAPAGDPVPVHIDTLRLERDEDRRAYVRHAEEAARLAAALGKAPALGELALGGLARRLVEAAAKPWPEEEPEPAAPDSGDQYREEPDGIWWDRQTRDGVVPVRLTTYTARIVADVARDDGAEVTRAMEIVALLRGREYRVVVPAADFAGMGWAVRHLGAAAVLAPGAGMADRARHAIQVLSAADGDIPGRTVYVHTGWRRLGDGWAYLHAGGAIGAGGTVPGAEVELPDALARFALPDPPTGDALRAAVKASLCVLDVAPLRLSAPGYSAVGRAPLGTADFGGHYAGGTGAGKTALAALWQAHWGADLWDGRRPPASWSGTGNALEAVAHAAKDALLLVDDFAPAGTTADVARMHRDADRLLRAQGNGAGRARMRQDTSLRPARPPRGLILSTGEDVPRGQSLRARLFIVEVSGRLGQDGADVDAARLSARQDEAGAGRYAEAMAGYVRWLAPRMDAVRRTLRRRRDALRRLVAQRMHARTPGQVADLALGLAYWLRFARMAGALTRTEAKDLWRRCWTALGEAAQEQAAHLADADPVTRFLTLLGSALASGEAHVAGVDGMAPPHGRAWGWRVPEGCTAAEPQGRRVGWVGSHDAYGLVLWLDPDASYAAAQTLAARIGDSLPVSPRTLRRRTAERGLLLRRDTARQVLTARADLEGRRRDVLWISADSLSHSTGPDQPDHGTEKARNGGHFAWSGREIEPDHGAVDPTEPDHGTGAAGRVDGGVVGLDPTTGRVEKPDPTTRNPSGTGFAGISVGSVGSNVPIETPPHAHIGSTLPAPCYACRGRRWWRVRGGRWTCGTCSPPARGLSVEWAEVAGRG